jgi:hypothetical protein
MLNALLLALTVTSQSADYNLITVTTPKAKTTIRTGRGAYADPKVAALADARAKVRAAAADLAAARAEVNSLTQDIAQEPPPRVRVEYADDPEPVMIRRSAPITYEAPPVTYRTMPSTQSAFTYSTAAPVMGESCYSSSVAPSTYSTPMVQAAPVTYAVAPPVVRAAPVTYSMAAPVTYAAAAPVTTFGSGTSTYQSRTRMGLFGNLRQNVRMTSTGFGSAAPMTFGSGFFGAGTVCVGGNCQ